MFGKILAILPRRFHRLNRRPAWGFVAGATLAAVPLLVRCNTYDSSLAGGRLNGAAGGSGFGASGDTGSSGSAGSGESGASGAGSGGASGDTGASGADAGVSGAAAGGGAGTAGASGMGGGAGTDGCDGGDCCPNDPLKLVPGACGCGVAETDTDSDGTPDCTDTCPSDPMKIAPGVCGCGVQDPAGGALTGCLANAIVHRYAFNGTGTVATDSVGNADGTVVNTTLNGSGSLTLAGGASDQYVDLPNGIAAALHDATFEAWVTWDGVGVWTRIFDFGASTASEGTQGNGQNYLFLTPRAVNAAGVLRTAYTIAGPAGETLVDAPQAVPTGVMTEVAVVVDDTNDALSLYMNGTSVGVVSFAGDLATLTDVNCWLGRSQFVADPEFGGAIHEFRVYRVALSAAEVAASAAAGPDPAFLTP